MALRLRIISEQRRELGERATTVFSPVGGTIGRAADNDWVLPDSQRYVSAHHARIHFRAGQYLLEDTSTNGVFVNENEQPLGKNALHALRSGDVLRLGDYQLVAALEPDAAAEPPSSALASAPTLAPAAATAGGSEIDPVPTDVGIVDPVPTSIEVLERVGRAAQTDIGAALDLDAMLTADSQTGARMVPVNAYGQAVSVPIAAPVAAVARAAPESAEESLDHRMERLARAAARAREARPAPASALYDVQSGVYAFCRGAGIDPEGLPGDAQTRILHLMGQLLREVLVGIADLERARHTLRNRFRVDLPVDPEDPRAPLSRLTVEELLVTLINHHETRRLDAVQWLRESVEQTKAHEYAMSTAMREAFLEFIGRFDPAELEARFKRAGRRGKSAGHAEYWELFTEFYRNLTEMPADHLPHTFVEAFARAYRERLKNPE